MNEYQIKFVSILHITDYIALALPFTYGYIVDMCSSWILESDVAVMEQNIFVETQN